MNSLAVIRQAHQTPAQRARAGLCAVLALVGLACLCARTAAAAGTLGATDPAAFGFLANTTGSCCRSDTAVPPRESGTRSRSRAPHRRGNPRARTRATCDHARQRRHAGSRPHGQDAVCRRQRRGLEIARGCGEHVARRPGHGPALLGSEARLHLLGHRSGRARRSSSTTTTARIRRISTTAMSAIPTFRPAASHSSA